MIRLETESDADALKAMLASDGWKLFQAAIDQEWSDASVIVKIDRVVKGVVAGDELTINESARSVLSAKSAVEAMMSLPKLALSQHANANKPMDELTAVEKFSGRFFKR